MKHYLIYTDEKSNKFWQIEINDNSFTVTYGKTGTTGQTSTKTFADIETCEKEANKLLAEKRRKGYEEKNDNSLTLENKTANEEKAVENQKFLVGKETWNRYFKGFEIIECAIRNKTIIYFFGKKKISAKKASQVSDSETPSRLIALYLDSQTDPNLAGGAQDVEGYNKPKIGVARKPLEQGMMVSRDIDGSAIVIGGGKEPVEEFIEKGRFPNIQRVKCINGYSYATGQGRNVYKRTDLDKWEKLINGIPTENITVKQGFKDIDGFSESDMYAVGGHGDVWQYNGKEWSQVIFPSIDQLDTVTCALDGNVYISGQGGSLWTGRNKEWKQIYTGKSAIPWNEVRWFNNQLWLCSDYNFCIWNGKEMQPVMYNGKQHPLTGHMDTYEDILVVASLTEAWLFNGNEWQMMFAPYKK